MASLESLKITECPAAFAEMAAKHNALCDLVAQLTGTSPIGVTVADRNAVISLDQNALESSLESFIYDTATFAAVDVVNNGTVDAHINGLITAALGNYVTQSDLTSALSNYVTSSSLTTTLANYVTTTAFATYFSTEFANVTNESIYDVCQNGSPVSVTFFTKP